MLKRYALPDVTVFREIESRLLQDHLSSPVIGANARIGVEPLLAFYCAWKDRYGMTACRSLGEAGESAGAESVLARLLHRNASYRAVDVCRKLMLEDGAERAESPRVAMREVLPAVAREIDSPEAAARCRLLQCCQREIDDILLLSDWRDIRDTGPHEVALYSLYGLAARMPALLQFTGNDRQWSSVLHCVRLLRVTTAMLLRHRGAVVEIALPIALLLSLLLRWFLDDRRSGDAARDTLSGTQMQLDSLRQTLDGDFLARAESTTVLVGCAAEELERSVAAIVSLTTGESVTHVSGRASTAAYKLSLNCHTLGRRQVYELADSMRVVLFLALQQRARIHGQLQHLLGRASRLLSSVRSMATVVDMDSDPLVASTTEALMEIEADLASRLWRVARHRVVGAVGGAAGGAAGIRESPTANYSSLPDQLALGLGHLPAEDLQLAADPGAADEKWCQLMIDELTLLAAGARRLKVYRIAALASVMLAAYQRLSARGREGWTTTACSLLQRAHHRLKRMLDQAAAWQEVSSAHTVTRQLYDWLASGDDEDDDADDADDAGDAIAQSRRLNRQIRAGLKLWMQIAYRGEDASGELVLLLELLQGQDELMQQWQIRHTQA